MRRILITTAPVALDVADKVNNAVSPDDVAKDVIAAAGAGAGMVHLHVRDSSGRLVRDTTMFSKTLDLIRQGSDILIQGSTGGVSGLSLEDRCTALDDPRVEVGSLNMGSVNFEEGVYINTLPDIRYWAKRMQETNVLPELEIFDMGMINNVSILRKEGCLKAPLVYAFCLGVKGALPADAYTLHCLSNMIPKDAVWGFIHHGMNDLSLLAAAVGMGASFIRVGFEDSIYYAPGEIGETNAILVEKAVRLIRSMGLKTATPSEARQMFGLTK